MKIPNWEGMQEPIVKGDQRAVSIAAASIVAKVTRDRQMITYSETFPEYNFARHKGYGTEEHLKALRLHGPTLLHRRTFRGTVEKCHSRESGNPEVLEMTGSPLPRG